MFYEINKYLRLSSFFLFWGTILSTILVIAGLVIFFLFTLVSGIGNSGTFGPDFFEIFLFMLAIFLVCTASLMLLILIRLYQIIEKWDQLLTIRNASSFLNLGTEGEKYLKANLTSREISRLREKQELKQAKAP